MYRIRLSFCDRLGQPKGADKCPDACMQAFVRNLETYSMIDCDDDLCTDKRADACKQPCGRDSETYILIHLDDQWALRSAHMIVCKHVDANPKLIA